MKKNAEKKSKIKVQGLPVPEKELPPQDQKGVAGGGWGIGGRNKKERGKTDRLLHKNSQ